MGISNKSIEEYKQVNQILTFVSKCSDEAFVSKVFNPLFESHSEVLKKFSSTEEASNEEKEAFLKTLSVPFVSVEGDFSKENWRMIATAIIMRAGILGKYEEVNKILCDE